MFVSGMGRLLAGLGVVAVLSGAALADDYAYTVDGNDSFQELDLTTGSTSFIGDMGLLMAGISNVGGNEYGADYNGSAQLYQIDTSTGAVTAVGSTGLDSSIGFAGFGSAGGQLYALGSNTDIYRVDATTGVATDLGSIGFSDWGSAWNLSSDGADLLFTWTDSDGQHVSSISTTDGSSTDLGVFSIDQVGIGATAFVDGTWYSGNYFSPYEADALDFGSHSANFVSDASGVSAFWGMSATTSSSGVPGPAAALPFLVGALARRRRR